MSTRKPTKPARAKKAEPARKSKRSTKSTKDTKKNNVESFLAKFPRNDAAGLEMCGRTSCPDRKRCLEQPIGTSAKCFINVDRQAPADKSANVPMPACEESERMVSKPLDSHPLAELLPMMSGPELDALQADIAQNGQRETVVLLKGKIIDGRNRHLILRDMGLPTRVRDFDAKRDGDPAHYVYSKACHRNLTESQKACAALNFEDMFAEDAKSRQKAGVRASSAQRSAEEGRALGQAANLFGVSRRYVQLAKEIREANGDIYKRVFEGHMPLSQGKRYVAPKDKTETTLKVGDRVTIKGYSIAGVAVIMEIGEIQALLQFDDGTTGWRYLDKLIPVTADNAPLATDPVEDPTELFILRLPDNAIVHSTYHAGRPLICFRTGDDARTAAKGHKRAVVERIGVTFTAAE